MITPPTGAQVYLATKPVDMRRGIYGLASLVEQGFGANPFSGALFVFRGKRGDTIKILACAFLPRNWKPVALSGHRW